MSFSVLDGAKMHATCQDIASHRSQRQCHVVGFPLELLQAGHRADVPESAQQPHMEVKQHTKRAAEDYAAHRPSSKRHRNAFQQSSSKYADCGTPIDVAAIGVQSNSVQDWHHGDLIPVLPGRLYFTSHENEDQTKLAIRENPKLFFFSSDLQELYAPLSQDFGPVSLDIVDAFIRLIRQRLHHPRLLDRPLVYYSYSESEYCTNAAFLLASYLVVEHDRSPHAAAAVFAGLKHGPFVPFRDSGVPAPSRFTISVLDCLSAVNIAMAKGWYAPKGASDSEGSAGGRAADGGADQHQIDMTMVCDKFVAFRGPIDSPSVQLAHPGPGSNAGVTLAVSSSSSSSEPGPRHRDWQEGKVASPTLTPPDANNNLKAVAHAGTPRSRRRSSTAAECARAFAAAGVSVVVRLNLNGAQHPAAAEPSPGPAGLPVAARQRDAAGYDPVAFTRVGIAHVELPFEDCSPPPPSVVLRFFGVVGAAGGRVAVHCQAGLGRTGTLLALYLMRRHHVSARHAIAWLRLLRPGSVIGAQQQFLQACERRGWSLASSDATFNPLLHLPAPPEAAASPPSRAPGSEAVAQAGTPADSEQPEARPGPGSCQWIRRGAQAPRALNKGDVAAIVLGRNGAVSHGEGMDVDHDSEATSELEEQLQVASEAAAARARSPTHSKAATTPTDSDFDSETVAVNSETVTVETPKVRAAATESLRDSEPEGEPGRQLEEAASASAAEAGSGSPTASSCVAEATAKNAPAVWMLLLKSYEEVRLAQGHWQRHLTRPVRNRRDLNRDSGQAGPIASAAERSPSHGDATGHGSGTARASESVNLNLKPAAAVASYQCLLASGEDDGPGHWQLDSGTNAQLGNAKALLV